MFIAPVPRHRCITFTPCLEDDSEHLHLRRHHFQGYRVTKSTQNTYSPWNRIYAEYCERRFRATSQLLSERRLSSPSGGFAPKRNCCKQQFSSRHFRPTQSSPFYFWAVWSFRLSHIRTQQTGKRKLSSHHVPLWSERKSSFKLNHSSLLSIWLVAPRHENLHLLFPFLCHDLSLCTSHPNDDLDFWREE